MCSILCSVSDFMEHKQKNLILEFSNGIEIHDCILDRITEEHIGLSPIASMH